MTGVRASRQEAALARTVARLMSFVPGLIADAALAALRAAKADRLRGLRELDSHLDEHPDALATGDPHCPLAVVRLTYILAAAEHPGITVIQCAVCGKSTVDLPVRQPAGRVCRSCAVKAELRRPCARCGQLRRINARRPEGGICAACYAKDSQVVEPCGQCGHRSRPVTRAADGTPRCQSCYRPPQHPCVRCGAAAPAHTFTEMGPVCNACYRAPRRPCGCCGQVRTIMRRATATSPDLCSKCSPGREAVCVICARTRPCNRNAHGKMICRTCRPRPLRTCARCGQARPIQAEWPVGPVCQSCYEAVRSTPQPCARCSAIMPLIGVDDHDHGICGACAGAKADYRCRNCGRGGRHYAEGLCADCVLTDRLRDLLTGPDGDILPVLEPVFTALKSADASKSLIRWCRRSPTARLLARLAAEGRPLTHALLDELPQDLGLHFARQVLVHTGVLPARSEHLERIAPWINNTLASRPAHHARLVRPYAHWTVLHRARRLAARRPYTAAAAHSARTRILVALEFLAWLDQRRQSLKSLQQADVDKWLATGPTRRNTIRYFLAWAYQHNLADQMTVPCQPQGQTGDMLDENEHYQQLHRCLFDEALPLTVRVAGALTLLFGVPLTKIARLTSSHITKQGDDTYLRFDQRPVLLPPRLATLVHQHIHALRSPSALARGTSNTTWLFPGLMPGQAMNPSTLGRNLTHNGINARSGRHTAVITLAADLPAPVLAELSGMHITTAVRWGNYAKRDWSAYVTERATPAPATERPDRQE